MDPIAPNYPIPITLEAQEWNQVLDVLANGPFRVVSPIIQKIATQAQMQQAQATQEGLPLPASNGARPALGGDI